MSTSGNPFGAAQAMAAFNQMNASNPFNIQGQQFLSQGLTKEQANQQSAQAFSAAVQAANPHLDFSKRVFNNMTGMVDPYQEAEDYYRRYGTGMPQTPGGSGSIASPPIGERPIDDLTQLFAFTKQQKNPNSAATQSAASTAASAAMPNFAQLFTADPTYKNFMGLNRQFNELTNAFGRGNSPFGLQDIQGAASAFQQAVQPYAQQFQEQSSQEVLAQRAAAQQQQQQQLRSQMQNSLGPGAVIQGNVTAPVNPFQQQAASIPLNQSPLTSAASTAASTAPTGSMFGTSNTRQQFLSPQPMNNLNSSMVGPGGTMVQPTQVNSAIQRPGGQGSGGMALEGRYGITSGNGTPFPIQGNVSVVKLSQGGDVSKARQMLQNLTTPVQRFADGGRVVPEGWRVSTMYPDMLLPVNATVKEMVEIFKGGEAAAANAAAAAAAIAAATKPAASTPAASTPAASTPAASTSAASTPAASTPAASTSAASTPAVQASAPSGNLSEGLQYVQQHPEIFGAGQAGVDKYYQNIRNFVKGADDLSAAEVRTEMNKYGVSDKDMRDALAGTNYSGGAVHALLNADIGGQGSPGYGIGGLSGMSSNISAKVDDLARRVQQGLASQGQAAEFFTTALSTYDPVARTGGFNEADFIRATGKTSAQLLAEMRPTTTGGGTGTDVGGSNTGTVGGSNTGTSGSGFGVGKTLTLGQNGLDPETAIVSSILGPPGGSASGGKISQEGVVPFSELDTAFRASSPRDPIYDRFGRVAGYNYSPAAKLNPATGTNVFNFVPPSITSRPRSLMKIEDVPGVTFDPVTGQMRLPLSASQQFARDRAEIDNKLRTYLQTSAATDTELPTQPPSAASTAFRNYVLSDPQISAQLRMRNISQTPLQQQESMPGGGESPNMQAIRRARSEYGEAPYASAMEQALRTFLNRNRRAFINSKLMQKSYFERYPDIATEYQKNWSKSMGPEEYALYHYRTLGQKEGRLPPNFVAQEFFNKGGEVSTEDFIKKQSGGDVSRETPSPNTAEVPSVDFKGDLIDEREEIRSESQRMLNRLQSQPSKLPPGLRRTVAATREQGKESMFPAAAPARDLLSGILGASPTAPGSEAYRTGQAIANMPPVQAAAAIPAKIAASAGDAATALAAMGPAMGAVVKRKGGNWLANAISDEMQKLKLLRFGNDPVDTYEDMKNVYTPEVMSRLSPETLQQVKEGFAALKPQVAINKWIDTKLAKYMQNEFATPEDPVRALIERGISPARNPGDINPIYDYNNVFEKRKKAGFPVEGLAETEAGRNWEEMADSSVNVSSLKDLLSSLKDRQESKYGMIRNEANRTLRDNPWLNKLTLPDTPIYGALGANYRPVLNHVIDELQNAMATNSGLPKNLQLDPDDLSKMNVPQVVELVDKINKWRVDNIKNLQLEETLKADLYKAYPEQKYRWVQLNRPGQFAAESDAMGHSVRGYEPPDKGGSDYYGLGGFKAIQSGEAKVYSLRDEKGQPHVTIEVSAAPGAMSPSEFYHSDLATQSLFDRLDKVDEATINRDKSSWWEEVVRESPEYQEYIKNIPAKVTQIKGKGNEAPAKKYWAFAQDFVKSGNWSDVQDLKNIGLRKTSSVFNEADIAKLKAMGEEVPNYVSGRDILRLQDLVIPEGKRLKYDDAGNIIGYQDERFTRYLGFKKGGPVNVPRETSTSKQQLDKLAQVSKRKKA